MSLDDFDDFEADESFRLFVAFAFMRLTDFDLDDLDVYVQLVVLDLNDFAFDDFEEEELFRLFVTLTFMRLTTFG
jgi:hypothetical protein